MKRKTQVFQLRLMGWEKDNLYAAAQRAGLSAAEYIRSELCRSEIPRTIRKDAPAEKVAELEQRTDELSAFLPRSAARRQAVRELSVKD